MGALSSWAMLALTHHLLVQYSATLVGRKCWYSNYELLGDDINIFDEDVANSYLSVMDRIGVSINLSKSVISTRHCFEFAKVTGYKGHNVSAVSWKMWMSQNNMMGRVNITNKMLAVLTPRHFLKYITNINRKSKFSQGSLKTPLIALATMFCNSGKISLSSVLSLLVDPKFPFSRVYSNMILRLKEKLVVDLLACAYRGSKYTVPLSHVYREEEF
jgi:hypothetical protein